MGLMEEASAWLADMCGEHLASRVLWRPSGGAGREVPAVFARTVFRAEDGYGLTTETESRDFIVRTADMPEEPRRGDRFVWKGRAYEVLAPAGQPVWLWCDGFMNARRIHTKETGWEDGNG